MLKTKKYKSLISLVLLAIFTCYYVNVSFFYHCHTINGVTIVHSHIHGKKHLGSEHSQSELTLISTLSLFQTLAAALFYLGLGFFALWSIIVCKSFSRKVEGKSSECIFLRAPPAII